MRFSIVDKVYKPTGVMLTDSDGNEYPELAPIEGYHVNALNLNEEDREKLAPYIVEVDTPYRKFAGRNDMICLKFANRDEWLAQGYEVIEEEI